jgi:DNA-binding CsgD family transcriptional regulator
MRNDGTGWAKVKTAKNQQGEILINEGGTWTPLPQKSDPSAPPKGYSAPPKMPILQALNTAAQSGARISLADEAAGVKSQFNMVAPGGPLGVFSDVGTGIAGLFMEGNAEKTGKPLDPRYTQARDFSRNALATAREDRPFTAFAGEVIGGGVYPGGALRMGAPIAREALKLGTIGAVQGTAYGYAAGEGDTQDRIQGAQTGAIVGGVTGAALPGAAAASLPAIRGTRTALANATDAIVNMFGGTGTAGQAYARQVAEAAVRRSAERSGMTPERILETLQRFGNKPAVLAEVIGQDAVNTLSSLTRRPGSTPQAAQDIIAERMGGFPERAADDLRQTTGLTDAQIRGEFGPELAARREAAAPAYTELFEQQGGVTSDRLTQLAGTNTLGPLIRRSQAAAEDLAVTQRRDPASVTPLEVLDLAKRELDDEIATAQRNQQNSELFRLQSLQTALLGELDELTGGQYAAARDLGGEAPRLQEARTQGEQALRPGVARATVNEQVGALNPQDRAAFASGTASVIDESIAGGRMLPQRFRLPANREKVQAAFGEEAGGEFANRMTAEAELRDLAARWGPRQGSITGTVMESGPSEALDDGIRFATSIARGDQIGFINQAVSWMRRRGYNQQQIDAMGELLLSNPQEGLRRLGIQLPRLPGGGGAAAAGAAAGTPPPPAGAPPPQVPPGSAPAPRTVGIAPATAAPVGAPAPTTPTRTSGIVGSGDLTNAAFGAGLGGIAPAESPEERARNMAIGAGIGGFARRGSQMLDDATRTVGQPRATSGRTVGAGLGDNPYFGRQSMRPPGSGPSPREIETQQQWATATPIVTQARTTAQSAQQAADAALQSKAPADIARAKDQKKTLVGQIKEAQASRAGMDTPEDARLAETLASLTENTSDPVLLSTQISAAKTSLDRLLTDIGSPSEGNLIPVRTNILTRTQAPRSAAEGPQDRASVTRYAEGSDDVQPMGFGAGTPKTPQQAVRFETPGSPRKPSAPSDVDLTQYGLTGPQMQVSQMILDGASYPEIMKSLNLDKIQLQTHVRNSRKKGVSLPYQEAFRASGSGVAERADQVVEMYVQGALQTEIAKVLGVHQTNISSLINTLKKNGTITPENEDARNAAIKLVMSERNRGGRVQKESALPERARGYFAEGDRGFERFYDERLSWRNNKVVEMSRNGAGNMDIAEELGISIRTVQDIQTEARRLKIDVPYATDQQNSPIMERVLRLKAKGMTNSQIAEVIETSTESVWHALDRAAKKNLYAPIKDPAAKAPPLKPMGFGAGTPQRTVGKPKTSQSARTVGKAKTN